MPRICPPAFHSSERPCNGHGFFASVVHRLLVSRANSSAADPRCARLSGALDLSAHAIAVRLFAGRVALAPRKPRSGPRAAWPPRGLG